MGEENYNIIQPEFNKKIKIKFCDKKESSDGGLLAIRELDERLGLVEGLVRRIKDKRNGKLIKYKMKELIRQRLYQIIAGYEDCDDADMLKKDPLLCKVTDREEEVSSQPTMSRLEEEMLAGEENFKVLEEGNLEWAIKYYKIKGIKRVDLHIDSSEDEVHGKQEGSAYNGHFGEVCYHPIFLIDNYGGILKGKLRGGNVWSAEGAVEFIEPVIKRLKEEGIKIRVIGDAAFAYPGMYELCEREKITYYFRLKSNDVLERKLNKYIVRRPRVRGKRIRYKSFMYKAGKWDRNRRVVVKIEWREGEIFPETNFIITNSTEIRRKVYYRYNQRGIAEQRIGEGKRTIKWDRLSCHEFRANEVRLQLYILSYNLLNLFREICFCKEDPQWSMERIRLRIIKVGTRFLERSRYLWFYFAGGEWIRERFIKIFTTIYFLSCPDG